MAYIIEHSYGSIKALQIVCMFLGTQPAIYHFSCGSYECTTLGVQGFSACSLMQINGLQHAATV